MDELLDTPEFRDYIANDGDHEKLFAVLMLGMELRIKLNEPQFVAALAAYALLQRMKQQQCRDERTVTA